MSHQVVYTKQAVADLTALPQSVAQRIAKKIQWFSLQTKPLAFAKALKNSDYGQYRFRVGDYRVIFDVTRNGVLSVLLILVIKHRRSVYQDI